MFFYHRTIFLPSGKVESFSELLWIVAVNDFILKFVAVIFKILIVMLPGNLLPYRKRVRDILHCSILERYDIITEKKKLYMLICYSLISG